MDFKKEIGALHLPEGSYMVVGSGILNALNIRDSNDIDLIISKESFGILEEYGWLITEREDGTIKITYGIFEAMTDWYGKNLKDMLRTAIFIDDIPYMSLEDFYRWKESIGRPKDLIDLELIDKYLLESTPK